MDEYLQKKNEELQNVRPDELKAILSSYEERINSVVQYVKSNFPFGFCHKQNHQTKRGVFEAISVGVWLALSRKKIKTSLEHESVKKAISSQEFMQYAGVASELHKKHKLQGRVMFIYNMVADIEG